ncbi:serine/arginine rich splicing factor, putative [Perkinsus marinus ATCC 50983]|uniref:Serine/arginine rich splicing factor, putative n=1 Tax=Perkinsus marinus (strain ATCC 50983 / TXsc) TaxID=423536 RepID=C5LYR3_PERM5|nr:serine/arginine rich splicing factor, putative [Perkinsus marinus ATCC 50983]EEQ98087.1 serine/arginine rich splicing factor, putative [Perkinsus marinus ATCC 50983]|eukprot:XP_002765370.1 serine/arginine rich splicing factor, putative [Perkinsus marinus ATCC 50983]
MNIGQLNDLFSIKVDGIDERVRKDDLREAFSKFGEIGDVFIPLDRYTGVSRGFGFVRFYERRDAEDAIRDMDNKEFQGCRITVAAAMYNKESSYGKGGKGYGKGGYGGGYGGGRYGDRSYDRYDDRYGGDSRYTSSGPSYGGADRRGSSRDRRNSRDRSRSPYERRRNDSRSRSRNSENRTSRRREDSRSFSRNDDADDSRSDR